VYCYVGWPLTFSACLFLLSLVKLDEPPSLTGVGYGAASRVYVSPSFGRLRPLKFQKKNYINNININNHVL
jgi:hypothetical protein